MYWFSLVYCSQTKCATILTMHYHDCEIWSTIRSDTGILKLIRLTKIIPNCMDPPIIRRAKLGKIQRGGGGGVQRGSSVAIAPLVSLVSRQCCLYLEETDILLKILLAIILRHIYSINF